MRFMMLMIPKGYEKAAPGTVPDAKAVAAMTKYNESMQKAGVLLALDGLHPPSMGARVSFPGGRAKVTDGPFTETKELVAGFAIVQVKSKADAIEVAKRFLRLVGEGESEVRLMTDMPVYPPAIQKAVSAGQLSR